MSIKLPVIMLISCLSISFSGMSLSVTENGSYQKIGKSIYYIRDSANSFSARYVYLKSLNSKLEKNNSDVFFKTFSDQPYWIVFQTNHSKPLNEKIKLAIYHHMLDTITYYRVDQSNKIIDSMAFVRPITSMETPELNHIQWFNILEKGRTGHFIHIFKIHSNKYYEIPMIIGSYSSILVHTTYYDNLSVLFIGVMGFMFLYNILMFFIIKNSTYLIYSAHILGITFLTTFLNNYPIINYILGVHSYDFLGLWVTVPFVFFGLFTIRFLDLKQSSKWFYKIIIVEITLVSLIGISNIFISVEGLKFVLPASIATLLLSCLSSGYFLSIKRIAKAYLFSLGSSVMVFSFILFFLAANSIIEWSSHLIIYLGATIEVIIFASSIAINIDILMKNQVKSNEKLNTKNKVLTGLYESTSAFNVEVSGVLIANLTSINSLSETAIEYTSNTGELNTILNKIDFIGKEGSFLVNNFIEIGRIEHSKVLPNKEVIDLVSTTEEVITSNNFMKKLKISIHKDSISTIKFYRGLLKMVLENLMMFGIKVSSTIPTAILDFQIQEDMLKIDFTITNTELLNKNLRTVFNPDNNRLVDHNLISINRIMEKLNGSLNIEVNKINSIDILLVMPYIKNS